MDTWSVIALVSGGIFCGGAFIGVVERIPLWSMYDAEAYAVDFRRSLRRADPMQPILLITFGLSTIGFATTVDGTPRDLALLTVALVATILVVSLSLGEPINNQFRRREEGDPPPNALELRRRWARLHRLRTALAIIAYVSLAVAVVSA